jgi:hypothetical protein
MMTIIREVVQQALKTGYLTQNAENQLRLILTTTEYDLEDMNAFMNLQLAAIAGLVKQESRELTQQAQQVEPHPCDRTFVSLADAQRFW